jgi:hypothetical protein
MPREQRLWVIDALTVLAEAFGEPMTPERLRIYSEDLCTLAHADLVIAFERARQELKFFPKLAELRELAGAKPQDLRNIEAEAAFKFVCDYLRKWGVDLIPLWQGGKLIEAPPLPSRVDYALRRIGGLRYLNQITAESRPFMQRDFVEAYNQAPLAESLAPQLQEMFGERKLLGEVKLLTSGMAMDSPGPQTDQVRTPPPLKVLRPKSIPRTMTQAEVRDRREMLRQQAEVLAAKRPVSETREVCDSVVLR